MISPHDFWTHLKKRNLTIFSGVPCSILKDVLKVGLMDPEITYISAVREDAALGIASGVALTGHLAGVLMQNSGLGNIINPLTSFNLIYRVPVLMIITWRGFQGQDAPEHLLMGQKMIPFLDELDIPYWVISSDTLANNLDASLSYIREKNLPAALILRRGVIG